MIVRKTKLVLMTLYLSMIRRKTILMTLPNSQDLISCLMRVVWAAAAGKLYLAAMGIQAAQVRPEKVGGVKGSTFLTIGFYVRSFVAA